MRFDTLQDWLQWLESCHPSEIELGLDRVGAVAAKMSLSLAGSKVITVAGTNGKGSCVASLNALLLSAGYRVGCYTSPHFIEYNERVVINSEPVSDLLLMSAFERIDQERGQIPLTYFEFGTLAALEIFNTNTIDVVVLEVGLGGRLDAVNIIDADVAIVTSIDLDHHDWLGSDREQIGVEKAGIFRSHKPAISAGINPPNSLRQQASKCEALFYQAGEDYSFGGGHGAQLAAKPCWVWRDQNTDGEPTEITIATPQLPHESVAAAIKAIQLLGLSLDNVDYASLSQLGLPGRFQSIQTEQRQLILDVAHNPAAATFLADRLQQQAIGGRTFALLSIMADKDVAGIIAALKSSFDGWFVADINDNPRAMAATELADLIHQQGISMVSVSKNIRQAYRRVLSLMGPDDRLIVFGSFFTVAEILKLVTNKQQQSSDQAISETNK